MEKTYDNGRVVIHRINTKRPEMITRDYILNCDRYDEQLVNLLPNDTGNARRFLLFCRDYVKYNTSRQEWLVWNGKLWESNNAKSVIFILAQATMDKYYSVILNNQNINEDDKQKMLRHALNSNNRKALENMLSILKHMNYVRKMDSKPYYLNTQNGVVNLKTKELMPHNPDFGCTNICNVAYQPDVKSSRFKVFVDEITGGDQELAEYLKKMYGYCVTGSVKESKVFFLMGTGSNGKSKLNEAICETIGNYHGLFPISTLLKSGNYVGRPTPELIPLIGKRFAYSSELEADNQINDGTFKSLSGAKKMKVRKMRSEYTDEEIQFKMVLDTNENPTFKYFDKAVARRVVMIPFNVSFEGKEKDDELPPKLAADAEYILKWLINGAYKYYQEGLKEPNIVMKELEKLQHHSDSVWCFVNNAIVKEKGSSIKSSMLYHCYVDYCSKGNFDALDVKSFSQALVNYGYHKKSKRDGNYFENIAI